jgi:hypothetical protein
VTVAEGAVEPLAARRASRTDFEGAIVLAEADNDARTGASIRGSSMAVVMWSTCCACFMRLFEDAAAIPASASLAYSL